MSTTTIKTGTHAASTLLDPREVALLLIDHQPQMMFGVQSHDRQAIANNVGALARTARIFGVPTILTTITASGFAGHILPQIQQVFPELEPIDRGNVNAFEDARFVAAVEATGRKKLIVAGLWTEVCVSLPVLSALEQGYEVYVVADASGGASLEAHQMGMQRMIQAGAIPVVWQGVLSEFQRDWTTGDTYEPVVQLIREAAGAWGAGVEYAATMLPAGAVGA